MNKKLIISPLTHLAIIASFTIFTANAFSAETSVVSVGKNKEQWSPEQALVLLQSKNSKANHDKSEQINNDKIGQSRAFILAQKAAQWQQQQAAAENTLSADSAENVSTAKNTSATNSAATSATNNAVNYVAASNFHHSFSIYQGFSQLIEDYDEDGYYQTFSVTFDADVYDTHGFDHARVYAELYLSKNGGDWIHYYTTEDFSIYGESEDDIFEVYTTLNQGYVANEYDVLIDLYEVGYSDIVATYSSNDTNALYALPLESSDYDPAYIEYHSESHGGSGSALALFFMLSIALIKRLKLR